MKRWDSQVFDHRFPVTDAKRDAKTDPYLAHSGEDESLGESVASGNVGEVAKEGGGLAGGAIGAAGGAALGGLVAGPAGAVAGAVLGGSAGESVGESAASSVSGEDETPLEKKNDLILRGKDASMSWGRSGQTETSHERNAETIPPGASRSMGIDPQMISSTDPTPYQFDRPTRPVPNCSEGNWNMEAIANSTRIG